MKRGYPTVSINERGFIDRDNSVALGEEVTRKTALAYFKMEKMYGFQDDKTNRLVNLGKEKMELAIAERLLKDSKKEVINNPKQCV